MLYFIFGSIFTLLAVFFGVLYVTYASIAVQELKKRARAGDEIARLLYRAVAYGANTKVLLVSLGLVSLYFGYILMDIAVGAWLTLPTLAAYSLIGIFFVRGKGGIRPSGVWLATKASPFLAWLAERLDPVLGFVDRVLRRIFPLHIHSGLYDKQDIVNLLEQQKTQEDNKISDDEIHLLQHALTFGDKVVADAMTPKRMVVAVNAEDSVGPILMGELYASGHSRFPVYDKNKDTIVGVLYLHDLIEVRHVGTVRAIMRPKVIYVHEDFSLFQTLQAFVKTQQHLFIVVNGFEEYVGLITIEDVIERVIGKLIVDEFDKYDDLRAVASAAAKKDHKNNTKAHQAAEQHTDTTSVANPTDESTSKSAEITL